MTIDPVLCWDISERPYRPLRDSNKETALSYDIDSHHISGCGNLLEPFDVLLYHGCFELSIRPLARITLPGGLYLDEKTCITCGGLDEVNHVVFGFCFLTEENHIEPWLPTAPSGDQHLQDHLASLADVVLDIHRWARAVLLDTAYATLNTVGRLQQS